MHFCIVLIKFASFAIFFNFTFIKAIILPPKNTIATKFLVQITKKCYSPTLPIIFIGKQSHLELNSFYLPYESMVILSFSVTEKLKVENEIEKIDYTHDYKNDVNPLPSNKFILNEIELASLKKVFSKLRKSIWYNLHGMYFIKNTLTAHSCDNAYSYLRIAWEYDLLSVIYICYDSVYSIQLYTFNPFSEDAPQIWEKVQVHRQKNGHPLVLFKLIKSIGLEFDCNSLNFNKALKLNGYTINLVGINHPELFSLKPVQKFSKFRGFEAEVAQLIWSKLNATVTETVFPETYKGTIRLNGIADGMVKDVLEGKFDYSVTIRVNEGLWRNIMYTYKQTKMCYVTKKRRLTAKDLFVKVVLSKECLLFLIIFLFFSVVIKYVDGDRLLSELLKLFRIFLGVNTLRKLASVNARIIYIGITIIFALANFYSQGRLFSIVTVPVYDKLIESTEDLINLNYTIYATYGLDDYLSQQFNISKKVITSKENSECFHNFKNNFRSACLTLCDVAKLFVAESSTIHLTEIDNTLSNYYVYMCRKNFSLHKQLVLIFRQAVEAGLINLHFDYLIYYRQKKNYESISLENISQSVHQLLFSFFLLAYGLIISIVFFVVEITYAYLKEKFAKVEVKVFKNYKRGVI